MQLTNPHDFAMLDWVAIDRWSLTGWKALSHANETSIPMIVEPVVFIATFPPIQSAIKIGQDGMRIQLDVPENQLGNAIELLAWRDRILEISIKPAMINMENHGKSGAQVAKGRDGKSKWEST